MSHSEPTKPRQRVNARQKATMKANRGCLTNLRLPKYLFSGLTKCAERGAAITVLARLPHLQQRAKSWHLHEPPEREATGRGSACIGGDPAATPRSSSLGKCVSEVHEDRGETPSRVSSRRNCGATRASDHRPSDRADRGRGQEQIPYGSDARRATRPGAQKAALTRRFEVAPAPALPPAMAAFGADPNSA